jgi:TonB family protein
MTTARSTLLLAALTWLAFASDVGARDEALERVKALYRSAAYEEALAILDQIGKDAGSATPVEVSEYRVLCLIALERKTEARTAIESMVKADPLYQLSQASPRVRTMFGDVRQSLLPSIVQHAYAEAKAAFDRQDPQSITRFERVLTLLNDPDLANAPTLADLRTVASAFRDLSKALAARPEPSPAAATPVVPVGSSDRPPAPVLPVVYREGEPGLEAPQVLNQALPRWVLRPGVSLRESRDWQGILEVVINEDGAVISATLLKSFHPEYDAQLVKAAMSWKYRPARKNGTSVRFLKRVSVRLDGAN